MEGPARLARVCKVEDYMSSNDASIHWIFRPKWSLALIRYLKLTVVVASFQTLPNIYHIPPPEVHIR